MTVMSVRVKMKARETMSPPPERRFWRPLLLALVPRDRTRGRGLGEQGDPGCGTTQARRSAKAGPGQPRLRRI